MTNEQNMIFVQSQIACFYGKLEAMKAANLYAAQYDHMSEPHSPEEFENLALHYGLEHNDVITTLTST